MVRTRPFVVNSAVGAATLLVSSHHHFLPPLLHLWPPYHIISWSPHRTELECWDHGPNCYVGCRLEQVEGGEQGQGEVARETALNPTLGGEGEAEAFLLSLKPTPGLHAEHTMSNFDSLVSE